jgi:hypothetical protein
MELLCIRLGTIVWTELYGWPWWLGKSRFYIRPKLFFFVFFLFLFFGIFNYHLRNSDRLAIFIMLFRVIRVILFIHICRYYHKRIVVTHNDCGSVGCHLRENRLVTGYFGSAAIKPCQMLTDWPIC